MNIYRIVFDTEHTKDSYVYLLAENAAEAVQSFYDDCLYQEADTVTCGNDLVINAVIYECEF